MDYQTLLENATNWVIGHPEVIGIGVAAIVIIGAINGIRRSLGYCKFTGRAGMRVL